MVSRNRLPASETGSTESVTSESLSDQLSSEEFYTDLYIASLHVVHYCKCYVSFACVARASTMAVGADLLLSDSLCPVCTSKVVAPSGQCTAVTHAT